MRRPMGVVDRHVFLVCDVNRDAILRACRRLSTAAFNSARNGAVSALAFRAGASASEADLVFSDSSARSSFTSRS
jgi:hypothetical protein